jgi:peptidoglycan/xylan/chitin deacetylase (PgdA/CDA1 family)
VNATPRERIARKLSETLIARIPLGLQRLELPRGVLSITFDDFPKSAWTVGGAMLAQLGVGATYYAAGGCCGRRFADVQQYDLDDLLAAHAAGHEIGCHTFDHLAATRHSVAELVASVERNGRFLRERLPGWVGRSFAYPYGLAPLRFRWAMRGAFAGCRSTVRGLNGSRFDPSLLRAVGLERWRRRRSRIAEAVEMAARDRRWIIVFTHDVSERPTDFGCTPAELECVIRLARAAGLDVRPVSAVLPDSFVRHYPPARPLRTTLGPAP